MLRRLENQKKTISADALKLLRSYSWPGNVRELENALERATAFSESETLGPDDFKLSLSGSKQSSSAKLAGMSLEEIEKRALVETLELCKGNRNKAAELLGISLKSIYNKVKKYELG